MAHPTLTHRAVRVTPAKAKDLPGLSFVERGGNQAYSVSWDQILVHLLKMMGIEPGDQLTVTKLDGSKVHLSFPKLDETAVEEVCND